MRQSHRTILSVLAIVGLLAGLVVARDYRTGTRDLVTAKRGGGAWLGVVTTSLDRSHIRKLNLDIDEGDVIQEVVADSPADKAGFEDDDVITEVDGEKINEEHDLGDIIADHDPGDKVSITLIRDGKQKQILVALGDREDYDEPLIVSGTVHGKPWTSFGRNQNYGYIGVSLTELTRQLGGYFGVDRGKGVLVNEVEKDSPAEGAGLKAGDVIVAIDSEKVSDISDAQEMIRDKEEGDKIAVSVIRDRKPMTLTVEVEEQSGWGNSDSWARAIVVPPVPPIPAIPRIKGRSHSHDAMEMYLDQAELEKDLAELREDLSGLSEELSTGLAKEYKELSKSEVRKLKRELERLNRDARQLH